MTSFSILEERVLGFDGWIVARAIFPLFSLFFLEFHLAFKILGQFSLVINLYFFFLISIINSFIKKILVTSFHQDFFNLMLIFFSSLSYELSIVYCTIEKL